MPKFAVKIELEIGVEADSEKLAKGTAEEEIWALFESGSCLLPLEGMPEVTGTREIRNWPGREEKECENVSIM